MANLSSPIEATINNDLSQAGKDNGLFDYYPAVHFLYSSSGIR